MHFKNRTITSCIPENFDVFPIVSITGPRQSGKSTLINHYIGGDGNWRYYSLDDRELLLRIKDDPGLFIKSIDSSIAIDEAQKAPELFHSFKVAGRQRIQQPDTAIRFYKLFAAQIYH